MKKNTEHKLLKLIEFCKKENIDISATGDNIYVTAGNGRMQEVVWTDSSISEFTELGDFDFDE